MQNSNAKVFDVEARLRELKAMSPEDRAAYFQQAEAEERARAERERRARIVATYHTESQVPDDLRGHRFDTFRPRPDQVKAWDVVKSWALEARQEMDMGRGIWFVAPPGRGKSAILCALLNSLPDLIPDRVFSARYANWADTIWDSKGDDFDVHAFGRKLMNVEFLLLDEIGTKKDTPTTNQLAYRVLQHRLTKRKPTFFITNADPAGLRETFGAQEVRRMEDMVPKMYRCAWLGERYEPEGTQFELITGGK